MERFFSTRASGLEVICFGSVMACGAGRVWDAVRTLIRTTITNRQRMRMVPRMEVCWQRKSSSVGHERSAEERKKRRFFRSALGDCYTLAYCTIKVNEV